MKKTKGEIEVLGQEARFIPGFNVGVTVSLGDVDLALDILNEIEGNTRADAEAERVRREEEHAKQIAEEEKAEAERQRHRAAEVEARKQESERLDRERRKREEDAAETEKARAEAEQARAQAQAMLDEMRRREQQLAQKEAAIAKRQVEQRNEVIAPKVAEEPKPRHQLVQRAPVQRPVAKPIQQPNIPDVEAEQDYDSMSIEALYGVVRDYMIKLGVNHNVVSRDELEVKFGKKNIYKLMMKSYLIALGKNVTIGR